MPRGRPKGKKPKIPEIILLSSSSDDEPEPYNYGIESSSRTLVRAQNTITFSRIKRNYDQEARMLVDAIKPFMDKLDGEPAKKIYLELLEDFSRNFFGIPDPCEATGYHKHLTVCNNTNCTLKEEQKAKAKRMGMDMPVFNKKTKLEEGFKDEVKAQEPEVPTLKTKEPEATKLKTKEPEVPKLKTKEQEVTESQKAREPEVIIQEVDDQEVTMQSDDQPEVIIQEFDDQEVTMQEDDQPEVIKAKVYKPEVTKPKRGRPRKVLTTQNS